MKQQDKPLAPHTMLRLFGAGALALALALGLGAAPDARAAETETGLAVVYSSKLHGRKTASGERYDMHKLTAAHKTLPFGTQVRVTNLKNKKTAVVRINDRGPMQAGRVIDLSTKSARSLGLGPQGSANVELAVVAEAPKKK